MAPLLRIGGLLGEPIPRDYQSHLRVSVKSEKKAVAKLAPIDKEVNVAEETHCC
jgi:hypothetical protein